MYRHCQCSCCDSINETISIQWALSVSLQMMEPPRLPLFDCYMCEMGSKRHRSLLPFTQRAPLITNDNSEIPGGCLSEMVGSLGRLLWRGGAAVTKHSGRALRGVGAYRMEGVCVAHVSQGRESMSSIHEQSGWSEWRVLLHLSFSHHTRLALL